MELSYFLIAGALSALISTLGHTVAWSSVDLFRSREGKAGQVDLIEVLLHVVSGVSLAFIYWLSWGFAAVVDVSWWVRGLAFGAACWFTLSLPALAAIAWMHRAMAPVALVHAVRWASTCLVVGLACAWMWERG
jgi:hypothetical protein